MEMKISDEIIKRTKAQYDKILHEFKALSTIIRIPKMTDEFAKMMR